MIRFGLVLRPLPPPSTFLLTAISLSPTPTFTISRVGLNTLNVAATGIHLEAITQAQVSGANTFINPGSGTLLFTLWNAAGTATPINQFVLPEPIVLFGSLPGPAPNSTSVTGDCLFAGSNGTLNVPITVQFWGREYTLLQGFR